MPTSLLPPRNLGLIARLFRVALERRITRDLRLALRSRGIIVRLLLP